MEDGATRPHLALRSVSRHHMAMKDTPAQPPQAHAAIAMAEFMGMVPGKERRFMVTLAVFLSLFAIWLYCLHEGLKHTGRMEDPSWGCGTRAIGFVILSSGSTICDFLYMARSIFKRGAQAGGCAHYFALTSEEDRVIVSKIMRGFFGRLVGSLVLGSACVLVPLAFWMDTPHHDTATMVGFIISGFCALCIQMTMCGHTYEFECSVIAMKQDTYVTKLFQGQMGVDDALVSLERLTTLRKKCKETWESELTIYFGMNYVAVTWCFYDYLYKTWSCGALLGYVIVNTFVFVSTLLPMIEMMSGPRNCAPTWPTASTAPAFLGPWPNAQTS